MAPAASLALLAVVSVCGCEDAKTTTKSPARDATSIAASRDASAPAGSSSWWTRAQPCPDGARLEKSDSDRNIRCVGADGKGHGPQVVLHANGKKRVEGRFVDGLRDGIWSQWSPEGELLGTFAMKKGTGSLRAWFDSGTLRLEETHVGGKRSGPYTEWYETGKPSWQRAYEDGLPVGGWQQWSRGGKLLGSLTFKRGSGRFTEWNDDGTVAVKGAYRRGKQHGQWRWLTTEEIDGKKVTIEFRQTFKDGQAGPFAVYENGKLVRDDGSDTPTTPRQTTPGPTSPDPTIDAGVNTPPPPPRLARVRLGGLRVSSRLDKNAVRGKLAIHRLHGCYSNALKTDPNLRGSLHVSMRIAESGAVEQLRIRGTSDSSFERCLVTAIGAFEIPAPSTGKASVQMTLELVVLNGR